MSIDIIIVRNVPRGTMEEEIMKMGLGRGLDSLLKVYDEETKVEKRFLIRSLYAS